MSEICYEPSQIFQPSKASAEPSPPPRLPSCMPCPHTSYADELSPLTDASIRDNATMLLKELKTKDAGR